MSIPCVVLLIIGDELLNGAVQDTNLFSLSRRLTHLGAKVREAALLRDNPSRLVPFLNRLLEQNPPDILITSGGLGPTEDDLTLRSLAQALNLPLKVSTEAQQLVAEQYARLADAGALSSDGSERIRLKLATLPQGAKPLPNPLGTAPAVTVAYRQTRIYCLPGVPAELNAIYKQSVEPHIRQNFELSTWSITQLAVHCQDEGDLATVLSQVAANHPQVYIKSLAHSFVEREHWLRVTIESQAPDPDSAVQFVAQARKSLLAALKEAQVRIKEVKS